MDTVSCFSWDLFTLTQLYYLLCWSIPSDLPTPIYCTGSRNNILKKNSPQLPLAVGCFANQLGVSRLPMNQPLLGHLTSRPYAHLEIPSPVYPGQPPWLWLQC